MNKIWKYKLATTDIQTIKMPLNPRILTVQGQYGEPCLWALVDPDAKMVPITIVIHGTGHPVPEPLSLVYVGSYQLYGGDFVGHVFYRVGP
jgi:hypothetical protein